MTGMEIYSAKDSKNSEDFSGSRLEITDNYYTQESIDYDANANQSFEDNFVSFEKFQDHRSEEEFKLLLASTYVLEAANGRNGYFIPKMKELRSYYWYNHQVVRLGLFVLITINLALVLFEEPAVPSLAMPYWATMLIEFICIVGYCLRLFHATKFMPPKRQWKDKKIIIVFVCIVLTLMDMVISVILRQLEVEVFTIRWSRVLRPAFMVNFSESRQVRRTVRNIRKTLPEISNVLVLFLLTIGLYALLGVKLFENRKYVDNYGQPYFTNYWDNYFDLYVLTTTANNPDIMIPAYNHNNWYSLFFVIFTLVCMYIFVSIFLAVVYKNYRTHLKNEVKAAVYRKRRNMKAAFDCLKVRRKGKNVVIFEKWKQLIHYMNPLMNPIQAVLYWRVMDEEEQKAVEFKYFLNLCDLLHVKMDVIDIRGHFFMKLCPTIYYSKIGSAIMTAVRHRFFTYFFDLVIIVNAFCVAFNEEKSDIAFLVLFNIEIILKMYTYGPKEFVSKLWNIFDTLVIEAATLVYIFEALFEILRSSQFILDFLLILRVLRLFKIIGNVQRFQVIINTILQIGPAIVTYGGIMFVLYYVFAVIGMEIFHNLIHDYPHANLKNLTEMERLCGNVKLNGSEFTRFYYCDKNFNNIAKSYIILFDLTVVNQWHVITDGFVRVTHKAARVYFFSFHMICVIVVMNIFVAFILEAFMLQYSFTKGKFEAHFEKQINEKGRAGSVANRNQRNIIVDCSLQRLDADFEIGDYAKTSGLTYRLREMKTKNAELLLQQMFEDELDDQDFGPEFDEETNDLEEVVHQSEDTTAPRKLTMQNIDFVV